MFWAPIWPKLPKAYLWAYICPKLSKTYFWPPICPKRLSGHLFVPNWPKPTFGHLFVHNQFLVTYLSKTSRIWYISKYQFGTLVLSWYSFREFWAALGSFGQFWAVKGGLKPSFGHCPAQNRFRTVQNQTLLHTVWYRALLIFRAEVYKYCCSVNGTVWCGDEVHSANCASPMLLFPFHIPLLYYLSFSLLHTLLFIKEWLFHKQPFPLPILPLFLSLSGSLARALPVSHTH